MNTDLINKINNIFESKNPIDMDSTDKTCLILKKGIINNLSKIENINYDFSKNIFKKFNDNSIMDIDIPEYNWLNYQINEEINDSDYDIVPIEILKILKTYYINNNTFITRLISNTYLCKTVSLKLIIGNIYIIDRDNLKNNDEYIDLLNYNFPLDNNLKYKDFVNIINHILKNYDRSNADEEIEYSIKAIYQFDKKNKGKIYIDDYSYKINKMEDLDEEIKKYIFNNCEWNFYIFLNKRNDTDVLKFLENKVKPNRSNEYSYSYNYEDKYDHENNGLCGLKNIGNTCYMNSALQCLSHTNLLRKYLLSKNFLNDINTNNVLGFEGKIAIVFEEILEKLWKTKLKSFNPSDFKKEISKTNPMFEGYHQNDSQEFLSHVIDLLHEDLNLINKKPMTELIEKKDENENDFEIAKDCWINHLKRNYSVINQIFYGQFKSEVNCPGCKKLSITFDSFQVIPLSIPQIKSKEINFYINSNDEFVDKVKYTIKGLVYTLYNLKISEIKNDLCKSLDTNPDDYFILNVDAKEIADDTKFSFYDLKNSNLDISIFKYSIEDKKVLNEESKEDIVLLKLNLIGIAYCLIMKKKDTLIDVKDRVFKVLKKFLENNNIEDYENELDFKTEEYGNSKISDDNITLEQLLINASNSNKYSYRNNYNSNRMINMLKFENSLELTCKFKSSFNSKHNISYKIPSKYPNYNNSYSAKFERKIDFQSNNIKKAENLFDLMDLFIQKEELDESNMWYCNKCKDHIKAIKKIDFYKLPPVLIFQMKKIKGGMNSQSSDENNIDFPIDSLDMSKYALNKKNFDEYNLNKKDFDPTNNLEEDNVDKFVKDFDGMEYELTGIINHYGSMNFGHYTAYCKNGDDWYEFNDSSVSKIKKEKIVNSSAYILFYQRKK